MYMYQFFGNVKIKTNIHNEQDDHNNFNYKLEQLQGKSFAWVQNSETMTLHSDIWSDTLTLTHLIIIIHEDTRTQSKEQNETKR